MATYDGSGVSQRLIYQTVHLETDSVCTRAPQCSPGPTMLGPGDDTATDLTLRKCTFINMCARLLAHLTEKATMGTQNMAKLKVEGPIFACHGQTEGCATGVWFECGRGKCAGGCR